MEADIRVVLPQAKQHHKPPEARRGKDRFFPWALKWVWPCWHLDLELLFFGTVRAKASHRALCLAFSIQPKTFFLNWTIPHNGSRPHNGGLYPVLYFLPEIRHLFLDAIQSIQNKYGQTQSHDLPHKLAPASLSLTHPIASSSVHSSKLWRKHPITYTSSFYLRFLNTLTFSFTKPLPKITTATDSGHNYCNQFPGTDASISVRSQHCLQSCHPKDSKSSSHWLTSKVLLGSCCPKPWFSVTFLPHIKQMFKCSRASQCHTILWVFVIALPLFFPMKKDFKI